MSQTKAATVAPELYTSADSKAHESQYTFSESYFNNSVDDIYVMNNHNLAVKINGNPSYKGLLGSDRFIIRRTYKFRGTNTVASVYEYVNTYMQHATDSGHMDGGRKNLYLEILAIKESLRRCLENNPQANNVEIHLDRGFVASGIVDNEVIFSMDCNVLLIAGDPYKYIHPESGLARNMPSKQAPMHKTDSSLSINMFIVDKGHELKKRFCTIGKLVFEIPVRHDDQLEDGLHMTKEDGIAPPAFDIVPLTELESYGVYSSKEEAEANFSHDDKVRLIDEQKKVYELKVQSERLKAEADVLRNQNELIKLNADRRLNEETAANKLKIAELENLQRQTALEFQTKENAEKKKHQEELNRLKEEKEALSTRHSESRMRAEEIYRGIAADRENYYDARSHERKDTSEVIKYGLPIAAGLVGGFLLRDKFH